MHDNRGEVLYESFETIEAGSKLKMMLLASHVHQYESKLAALEPSAPRLHMIER